MRIFVIFIIIILLLSSCVIVDTFPITSIVGNYKKSQQVISEYCKDKMFNEAIYGLQKFDFKDELGNVIILPNIFFKQKSGDCDDFAVASCMIAQYFGYESYIGYLIFDGYLLHYNCIIKTPIGFAIVERGYLIGFFATPELTAKAYLKQYNSAKYIEIKSFERFLQDIGIDDL